MKDRAYEIARSHKYDGYQRALATMVYRFFDKKTGLGLSVNEGQAEELHKPVIKKEKESWGLKTIFRQQISWNGIIVFLE